MLIKWGSIIVKGSGKLGGHVFSSGKSGASVHTASKARNPQTVSQSAVRSRFTKFTQGWRDLTESQRESWYAAESSYSRTNRFGDVVSLTGKNLYESLNSQRNIIGLNTLQIAPMPTKLIKNVVETVRILPGQGLIEIKGRFAHSQNFVIVATPSLSLGTQYGSGSLRIIGIEPSTQFGEKIIVTGAVYNDYVSKFGVPPTNGKIFIGTYSINESGQKSSISTVIATYT